MKRLLAAFVCSLAVMALSGAEGTKTFASGHYSLTCPSDLAGVEDLAAALNREWDAFNAVFRFDPSSEGRVNKVVIPRDKAEFDAYLVDRIGEARGQPVFLRYSKPELSELVLLPGTNVKDPSFPGPALNRQLFLQYLYGYVAEPPAWIRDGFQAYFENLAYDAAKGAIASSAYSPWLETAKRLSSDPASAIGCEGILSAITGSYESTRFYPQAWAFVAFLLNTESPEYQRFFHETCLLVAGSGGYNPATQQENTDLIRTRFFKFQESRSTDQAYATWLSGQHTYAELFQLGVTAYNQGNYAEARKSLGAAAEVKADDPVLLYYQGLVSYAEKKYGESEAYYRKALELGGDNATIHWALGLEAYADKRYQEAKVYLETAKSANPVKYAEKADKLIGSMPKAK